MFQKPLGAALAASMLPAGQEAAPRRERSPRGRRAEQSAADHAAALSRAFAYQQGRARSTEELTALWEEYEHRMQAGPDFLRVRAKSEFREAPPHQLDREQRARLRFLFNSMGRGMWHARKCGKHRGAITRTGKDVMGALLFLAERYPRLFPSLLRLASLAQCCKQSVVAALAMLERLGWLTRHRRVRRRASAFGPEMVQDTNAYELHVPGNKLGVMALSLFTTQPESKSWAATDPESLSFLKERPEAWGSPSVTQGDAYGEPPKAAHI